VLLLAVVLVVVLTVVAVKVSDERVIVKREVLEPETVLLSVTVVWEFVDT